LPCSWPSRLWQLGFRERYSEAISQERPSHGNCPTPGESLGAPVREESPQIPLSPKNVEGLLLPRPCHLPQASVLPVGKGAGNSNPFFERLYLPVRHGEGKFFCTDERVLRGMFEGGQVVVRYIHPESGRPTMEYPWNPNGSLEAIAGICDPTGRLMGLMPHPEAYHHRTNHPRWTRESLPEEGEGVIIFRNAVNFAKENLL
jgi:hypothetical protein